ncbi:MAG: hypothetical protein ACXVZL_04670 [Gaiellaceae bacterium]
MLRVLPLVLLALVFAPAGRAADHCCVAAGLDTSYDAASHRIGVRWGTPLSGATAVELRISDRLGADGVADASSPRSSRFHVSGSGGSVGAGPLAVVLAAHGGIFVQVRFTGPARPTGPPCATGAFWSKPVQLTADDSAPTKQAGGGLDTTQHRVQITSNGTQACKDAFARLSKVIAALNANTQAAIKAKAAHKDTAPYAGRQKTLKALFDTEYAKAQKACAKR